VRYLGQLAEADISVWPRRPPQSLSMSDAASGREQTVSQDDPLAALRAEQNMAPLRVLAGQHRVHPDVLARSLVAGAVPVSGMPFLPDQIPLLRGHPGGGGRGSIPRRPSHASCACL
jgi:hypothetical protein